MLEILKELGLSEEMAEKVIAALEKFMEENAEKPEEEKVKEENEAKEEKTEKEEIPPVGKADETIPSKAEFEKMGYLAKLELAKSNPGAYEKLKNER